MVHTILVTGGAGFIGSAVIRYLIQKTPHRVVNIDKLTYAGHLESLLSVSDSERYHFIHADICNKTLMEQVFDEFQPDWVMHLAAESHVDRSINAPAEFIQTNIVGTSILLEVARAYWDKLISSKGLVFGFIIFQQMKSMGTWRVLAAHSMKRRLMLQVLLILPVRRVLII